MPVVRRTYRRKRRTGAKTIIPAKPAATFSDQLGGLVGRGVTSGVNALSKWLGFGAYTIKSNTVIGAGGTVPSMHSTHDSIIVRHREYIGDIQSSTTFNATQIPLNPGMTKSIYYIIYGNIRA
jgi:hypothetical protein